VAGHTSPGLRVAGRTSLKPWVAGHISPRLRVAGHKFQKYRNGGIFLCLVDMFDFMKLAYGIFSAIIKSE